MRKGIKMKIGEEENEHELKRLRFWKTAIMQGIALVGMHIIAFAYDGQWIYWCMGVDVLTLGYSINAITKAIK